MLLGRGAEVELLDRLLAGARSGSSGALVLRGEAGIGKSALLDHAAGAAVQAGTAVLRGRGVEPEAELAYAALLLLLRPRTDRVDGLPAVQARALRAALGLAAAPAEDPLLVGLAVLTLLSDLAEEAPLLVLVDDAQWLDRESAAALLFAARRLAEEAVVLVFAVRDGEGAFPDTGLPELRPAPLDDRDATALLAEHHADLTAPARDRILAEAAGNPLALLALPAGLTAAERAGEPPPPGLPVGLRPVGSRVQDAYRRRIEQLPEPTRTLLLVAAADDRDAVGVLMRAARTLGAEPADLEPAERAGLVTVEGTAGDTVVRFRHPLVRAAAYHDAPFGRRLAAHAALAGAYDTPDQADRHAWHRAAAAVEPDEAVAAELEQAAERARRRGGFAAIASAYERAAQLSVAEPARVRRTCAAAVAARDAGLLPHAADLAAGSPGWSTTRGWRPSWPRCGPRWTSSTARPGPPRARCSMRRSRSDRSTRRPRPRC